MKIHQVTNCMFPNWYPQFKNVTIRSRVIEIPQAVIEYLLADGIVLLNAGNLSASRGSDSEEEEEDETNWTSQHSDNDVVNVPDFPEFEAEVAQCIQDLGGSVFVKLDWSSPKDAVWITFGRTLRCTNFADILLLLKSSDFVMHDLTDPFGHCEDSDKCDSSVKSTLKYHLVLRRWQEISPDTEFRCFVRNNNLVGISQRHQGIFFPCLSSLGNEIRDDVVKFFENAVKGKFVDKDYTFDVWRRNKGRMILIDFNPFGTVTDSLLFTWAELSSDEAMLNSQFRCVHKEDNLQPDPYRFYAIPQDFVHLTTGEDPAKFMDLLTMKIQTANDTVSDNDD